jgi:flagellar hook-associated protein 2
MRNDPTIAGVITQMRTALYKSVGENENSLYEIGITTVSLYNSESNSLTTAKNGHLEITEDGMKRLRAAIETNPDMVRDIFTKQSGIDDPDDTNKGVGQVLNEAILRATNPSSDPKQRGSLISIAGTEILTGDNTNTLDTKIKNYDDNISRLKTQLEKEYNRYWRQFSALETAIQQMTAQSGWLTQMMGGQ